MSITSLNFFFCLIVVLAIYYLLSDRLQIYWLLVVSHAFYITWAWQLSLTLLFLTVLNYHLGRRLQANRPKQALLWLGIAANVGALLFFRQMDWFAPGLVTLLSRLGIGVFVQPLEVFLPIGLAYYSLQNISYLVDVHRAQMPASDDPASFALYLAYFPKLLSGPIEPARTFLPKLRQPRHVDNEVLARSFTLIIIGLIRKLFIAGILSGIILWDAFETPAKYTGPELASWLLIYGLFLYNDFAGYTGIARGVSGLFGLELSRNFRLPYFARTISEFWNSWHISLSHWLRDYIYFPASRFLLSKTRNPRSFLTLVLPPVLTMLVSGLWHGLGWHMLLWGGIHGIYQAGERLMSVYGKKSTANERALWRQLLSAAVVIILVNVAWVPFIMQPEVAFAYWRGMFDWTYPVIRFRRILIALAIFAAILAWDALERRFQDEVFLLRAPQWVQSLVFAVFLFILGFLMQAEQMEPFVYQQF
jgi:alginate O-acetyltransferase complex protein AlgI